VDLFTLPSTNYEQTLSDDAYHLGLSVEVKIASRHYEHRIPTKPVVLVSTVTPTTEQQVRFLQFISGVSQLFQSISSVPIPEHITLRWKARNKELTIARMLGHDDVPRQAPFIPVK